MPEPNKSGAILPAVMEEDAARRGIEATELLQGGGFVKLEKGACSHVLGLLYRLGRGRFGGRGAHRRGRVVAPSPERTRSRGQRHSLGLIFSRSRRSGLARSFRRGPPPRRPALRGRSTRR